MIDELEKVIKSHLPEQVGSQLKARLEEAERVEAELKRVKQDLDQSKEAQVSLSAKYETAIGNLNRAGDLDRRESGLLEREANQTVFELKAKLEAVEGAYGKIIGFVDALMRNTEFRRGVFYQTSTDFDNNGSPRTYRTGEEVTEKAE